MDKDLILLLEKNADKFYDTLREYRLSGDIQMLGEFVKAVMDDMMKKDAPSRDHFVLSLTDTERLAFDTITEQISADEGFISVVKLIQKSSVSRPVYDALLRKMRDNGVAIVESRGAKGTFIRWLA
jgi:GTP-sensing pleiotropic transcriptional regulator CodY